MFGSTEMDGRVSILLMLRRIAFALAVTFLLVLGWWMCRGAIDQLPRAHTTGQRVETYVQFACALLCPLCALTGFRRRSWTRYVRIAWAASVTTVAGTSALVWGPPMLLPALAFATAALLVSLTTVRALDLAVRNSTFVAASAPSHHGHIHTHP